MPSELFQNSLQELRQQRNRQQEEMAQLDATLAADRIRRAAERARLKDVQRVAVDINTKVAERVLSSTHAVLEAKLAETAVKEKELQSEIQKRLVKREGERERELVRRTAVRKREAERRSQLKGSRTQNKKYVTQSAEFYGADFSKPPENVEIVALQKRRSDEHENVQNSEQVRLRGGVFIQAITRAADARRSSMDLLETGATRSAEASSEPTVTEPKSETEASKKRPMRLDALVRPALDYSDLFSSRVGKQQGIMVYRIENLRPVPQPGDTHGKFCVADCYIVLHTAPGLDNPDGLDWTIWQWCGSEASLDKRACSAIYAVNLRNFLGATSRIQHESHCEESPEFLQIFEDPIEYLPATDGTDSGLLKVMGRRSPLRLYRIYGERNLKARLVAPEASSLHTDGAFLLEQNRRIFVWIGKNASLQNKGKARLMADLINSSERSGRAEIDTVDEGSEPEEFWDLLGARPHVASGNEEGKDIDTTEHDEAQSREKYEFEQLALRPPILYRVTEELQPNLRDHDITPGYGSPLKRSLLQTTGCYILDCGVELFLWVGREASASLRDRSTELLTQVVMQENRPRWLGLHKIFEFCEVEVFRMRFSNWSTTGGEVKTIAKTVPATSSPSSEGVKVDVAALYAPRSTVSIMEDSDLNSLIARANQLLVSMTSFEFVRGRFVRSTDPSCNCLHDTGAFLFLCTYRLEEEGQVETPSPSSPAKSPGILSSPAVNEREKNSDVECVVYFWEGGRAPKASWPTFTLKALSEIKTLVQKQWGAEVKVVRVTPFREPVALLAHWKQELLVRRQGGEATDTGTVETSNAEMFHIRTDPQYKATRGIQVLPAKASRLVSRDCFYVRATQEGKEEDYLWVGKGASKDETRRATQFVKDMFRPVDGTKSRDIKTVSERSEPPAFWSILGGKESPQPGSEFYYVKPPRFFRCEAATTGNYRVEELPSPAWGQRDLRGDTCVILDPGAPEMCYMWVGNKASDVVVKLTKRAVEVYLDHCDDGRQFIGTLVSPRNEPPGFSQKKTDEETSGNRGRFRARRERHRRSEGDVLMVLQGQEPDFFQAFFHGWDLEQAGGPKDDKDVGNVFSREEDKRKIRRQQERERKRQLEEGEKLKRAGSRYKSLEDLLTDKEKRLLQMENKSQQDQLASEIEAAAKGRAISHAKEKSADKNDSGRTALDRSHSQMGSERHLKYTDVLDQERRELNATKARNEAEGGQGAAAFLLTTTKDATGFPQSEIRPTAARKEAVAVPESVGFSINGPVNRDSESEIQLESANDGPQTSGRISNDRTRHPMPISVQISENDDRTEDAREGNREAGLNGTKRDLDAPSYVNQEKIPGNGIERDPYTAEEKMTNIPNNCESNINASGNGAQREVCESLPHADAIELAGRIKQPVALPMQDNRGEQVKDAKPIDPNSSLPSTAHLPDAVLIKERESEEVKEGEQSLSLFSAVSVMVTVTVTVTKVDAGHEARSEKVQLDMPSLEPPIGHIGADTLEGELQEKKVNPTEQKVPVSSPSTSAQIPDSRLDPSGKILPPETQKSDPLRAESLDELEELNLGQKRKEQASQEKRMGQKGLGSATMPMFDPPGEGFETSPSPKAQDLKLSEDIFLARQREQNNRSEGDEGKLVETEFGANAELPQAMYVAASQEPQINDSPLGVVINEAGTETLRESDRIDEEEQNEQLSSKQARSAGDEAALSGSASESESTEDAARQVAVGQREQGRPAEVIVPACIPKSTAAEAAMVVPNLPGPEELKVETKPQAQKKTKKTKISLLSSSSESEKEPSKKKRWFQR